MEESEEKLLSKKECNDLLRNGGLMIRNTYDFDTKEETSFWYVIKDKLEDISELPFSARRNIRRAHKFYNFTRTNKKTIIDKIFTLFYNGVMDTIYILSQVFVVLAYAFNFSTYNS